MTNLASCQNKEINQQGFCIQDSLIYYNGQKFEVAGPVDNFVKIAGKPDRIVTDSLGGYTIKDWMWNKKLISVNKHSNNNYYTLTTLYYDKEKNEFNDDTVSAP
ncbi:Lipoprotein [Flavobacterium branchiophilum]|uniref:DUF7738 domain-containing protein n=2 Tax=Flavobacterium branchiophilum TaxID=55197 RepID=G2Z5K8_FLABF|nr:Hypothetical protein FBFL15_2826 [Flavobacterium branchiophilum FL-15]